MKHKLSYLLIALILLVAIVVPASAQFGIGTTNPDPSAALDIVSTTQGVLTPRLTTAQRDAISSPAEGLTIYNTTDKCLQVWDGAAWKCAVGGSSGGANNNSGVTLTTGSSGIQIEESLAAYKRRASVDALWLDNDRFLVVEPLFFFNSSVYSPAKEVIATIYNRHFNQLVRFSVPVPTIAVTARPVLVEKLQNGNLIFATLHRDPSTSADNFGIVITQEDGTVVTPWQVITPVPVPSGSYPPQDMVVLDNGNVVISSIYVNNNTKPTSIILDEDGTFIRVTHFYAAQPALHSDNHAIAATSFGFVVFCTCYPLSGAGPFPALLELYDFDGNVLAQRNFGTNSANPFGAALYPSTSTTALTRVQGNTLYAAIKRQRDNVVPPTLDEFDPAATVQDSMMGGFRKFEVNATGVITVLNDLETYQEPGLVSARFGNFMAAAADGRLFAIGSKIPDLVRMGVSATSKYNNGASLPIMRFGANLSLTDVTNLAVYPASYRDSNSSYSLGISWLDNFTGGAQSQHLLLSPDGQKLFVMMNFESDAYYFTFDLSTGALVPYTRTLIDNHQAQSLPKTYSFYAAFENLTTVEVAITSGAGTLDTLTCVACSPAKISGSYNAAAKVLTLTKVASTIKAKDFGEMFDYLTFTPDGPGTRTFEIKATSASGVVVSKTAEFEVVAP